MRRSLLCLAAAGALGAVLAFTLTPAHATALASPLSGIGNAAAALNGTQEVRHRRWHRRYRYCPRVRVCSGWGYYRHCWWERRCYRRYYRYY
jgi:hypothetical protein